MPSWVTDACDGYAKRLPKNFAFQLAEIPQSRDSNPAVAKRAEGEALLSKLGSREFVIALDVTGSVFSTEAFAVQIQQWQLQGRDIGLLIGGPDGLSQEVLQRVDMSLSLSAMTLPHPLARIVLIEQIYRAHTILTNHPYHRA